MQFPGDFEQATDSRLWAPKDGAVSFSYSDGEPTEQYLIGCLGSARDLSTGSEELGRCIRDWPTLYHLSPLRANLLRPIDFSQVSTILELGAGCGALTRYMGELGKEVIAVEGSFPRAKIGCLRTAGLENVQFVATPFQDVSFPSKFDMVTMVGTLEYSAKYIGGENPYGQALALAKSFLKPDGVLVLAIENRLGSKYFQGCGEDHTGIPYDGLEGYPSGAEACTFGEPELRQLLARSGYPHAKFLYPYPDYKLPRAMLFEPGVPDSSSEPFIYQWLGSGKPLDYSGLAVPETFDPFLLNKHLEINSLLGAMANSFLVLAGSEDGSTEPFLPSGRVLEQYLNWPGGACGKEGVHQSEDGYFRFSTHEAEGDKPLVVGESLLERMVCALKSKKGDPHFSFGEELRAWFAYLEALSESDSGDPFLQGDDYDRIPSNLVYNQEGVLEPFRTGVCLPSRIPMETVINRGLILLWKDYRHLLEPLFPGGISPCEDTWVTMAKETFGLQ